MAIFEKLNHLDRDQKPVLHDSGFETLIKLFDGATVFRILVIDSAGHAGTILCHFLVSRRDEKGGKALSLLRWGGLDFVFDFLNAHWISLEAGKFFASSQMVRMRGERESVA
jgi:hypothetical protein